MTTNLTSTIDRLGALQVAIAKLEVEEKALKAVMVEVGPGKYQGEIYTVTVTEPSTREGQDAVLKAKVEELLLAHTSVQFRVAHTIFTQVRPAVRVAVRKDVGVAA